MSKQSETIQQLTDRINALEAICFDLLTLQYNNASQAQVKFDDYRIKYTQEAIDKREAEAREKMLKESLRAATAEFKERERKRSAISGQRLLMGLSYLRTPSNQPIPYPHQRKTN